MKTLYMACAVIFLTISLLAIANGKSSKDDKPRLPIELSFSPLKSENKASYSYFDKNHRKVQVEIRSNDSNKSDIDLLIAATNDNEATTNSIELFSPKYDLEEKSTSEDPVSKTVENDTNGKESEISRKDIADSYQPPEFSEVDLPSSTQKLTERSHDSLFNIKKFSPLENLKYLEKNLEKEMQPRYLEQALTTLQYGNSQVPYGMMLSRPMFYGSQVSMYQPNPDTLRLGHIDQHPQKYYNPHQMQIPKHTPIYVENGSPQRNAGINPYSDYINPNPHPVYPERQPQINIKELSRDPRYNSESSYGISSPESKTLLTNSGKPEYNTMFSPVYNHAGIHKEHLAIRNYPENYSHNHQRIPVNPNYQHSDSQHQVKDKVPDRNLYYTPIPDKYHKYGYRYPTYVSNKFRKPVDYQELNVNRIIPQNQYRELIHLDDMNRLRPQNTLNNLKDKQVPHYTIVPQHLLPNYLKNPVHSQHIETYPTSMEKRELQSHPNSYHGKQYRNSEVYSGPRNKPEIKPLDYTPELQYHQDPQVFSSPRHKSEMKHLDYPKKNQHQDNREYSSPQHKLQMKHLDSPPEQSLPQVQHKRYPNQMSSIPPQYSNNEDHQKYYPQNLHSIPGEGSSEHSHPVDQKEYPVSSTYHVESEDPHRKYSIPPRHLQMQDSVKSENHGTGNKDRHLSHPKKKKKYKKNNKNGRIPYEIKSDKNLKEQSHFNQEDFHGHASHQ
ncbi:hypothetical protein JTE90_008055 [Oedothorax gibbosus]|uniref:Uncharacterized protein n=1 Tax=Oedothorax gibbosus TaxID=931172 RepID=A0AAV6UVI4_9ARAC|nr:hypothetical protein JTE90_008055 [Oedothorax gibbosus]